MPRARASLSSGVISSSIALQSTDMKAAEDDAYAVGTKVTCEVKRTRD